MLERIRFRAGGEPLAIDRAESVYAALRRTPFVSPYGSSNWYDDLAEFVAVYHLTEKLGQPYRIVIRRARCRNWCATLIRHAVTASFLSTPACVTSRICFSRER